MKKNSAFSIFTTFLIPSIAFCTLFSVANNKALESNAYPASSLPTTIDLNDTGVDEVRSYYSALNNLENNELSGTNLLKNLKGILKNGQKYYSYDTDKNAIWKAYEIIDRDWVLSPASEISGYDPITNVITGYSYTTGEDPYLHALYVNREMDNPIHARENHSQTYGGINQEHIWPKSQGFNESGGGGARGDLMHLWAADGKTNNMHNNNMYGYVNKKLSYSVPSGIDYASNNYSGTSLTMGTGTVFEPQDCDKGDIARALFYMAARYNNFDGDTNIDQNNPNLRLTNISSPKASYTSTSTNPGLNGIIDDLLEWNKLDPVDQFEIHRNNLCFNNFTYNRNPFIDFPQWADIIWGNKVGKASPSSDEINGGQSEVILSSISVDTKPQKLVYTEGEEFNPEGMIVKKTMSDGSKEVITDYTYFPTGELSTSNNIITISYNGKNTSLNIAVKPDDSEAFESSIKYDFYSTGWKASIAGVDGFDWINDKTANGAGRDSGVGIDVDHTGAGATSPKDFYNIEKIIVEYKQNKAVSEGSIEVFVNGNTLENIEISSSINSSTVFKTYEIELPKQLSGKVSFKVNVTADSLRIKSIEIVESGKKTVDPESITLDVTQQEMNVGETIKLTEQVSPELATVKLVKWTTTNPDVATVKDGVVTAIGAGKTTIKAISLDNDNICGCCEITVANPVTLKSIQISGNYPTEFFVGDKFNIGDMVVTANYSDLSTENVTDLVDITGYDLSTDGEQTVTVSYETASTTYKINVTRLENDDNEVTFIPSQLVSGNAETLTSYDSDVISIEFSKGTGSLPKYYTTGSSARIYAGNTIKISSEKKITKVVFTFGKDDGENPITCSNGEIVGDTWIGDATNVLFSFGGTSGNRRISAISVYFDPDVTIKQLSRIELEGTYKTHFNLSDSFESDGLKVKAIFEDGSSEYVSDYSISGYDLSTAGNQTVTVSYNYYGDVKTETYKIFVIDQGLEDIVVYEKITSIDDIESGYLYAIGFEGTESALFLPNSFSNVDTQSGINLINNGTRYTDKENKVGFALTNFVKNDNSSISTGLKASNKYLSNNGDNTKLSLVENEIRWTITESDGIFKFTVDNTNRVIKYRTGTYNVFGFYSINSTGEEYNNISLFKEMNLEKYTLVSDTSELGSGDEIVFADTKDDVVYSFNSFNNADTTKYGVTNGVAVLNVNDKVLVDQNVKTFTVEENESGFRFYNADWGYLTANITNYKECAFVKEASPLNLLSIDIDNSGNTSVFNGDKYFRFNYNGGSSRFTFYSKTSNVGSIKLYKKTSQAEADEWANKFLNNTYNCNISSWGSLKDSYNSLSEKAKNEIINAVTDKSEFASARSQAMARYEYILLDSRFNKGLNNFISQRNILSGRSSSLTLFFKNTNSLTILIVSTLVISILSIGSYVFIKTRKFD